MTDSVCDRTTSSGRWVVVGSSVTGTSHRRASLPCQDSWNHCVEGEALIAAVADGAGSAPMSDVGSALAVETSVRAAEIQLKVNHDHAPHPLDETCLNRVLRVAAEETRCVLEREAELREVELGQLATTLLLAVHTGTILAVGQIGDGATVVADFANAYSTVISPQRGEYANQTNFLTSNDALSMFQIRTNCVVGNFARLVMFTDGLQDLVLDASDDSPHVPFFDPLFEWLTRQADREGAAQQLSSFLKSPRVSSRTDDDLTLVMAEFTQ